MKIFLPTEYDGALKTAMCGLLLPFVSKRNMTEKLGHKITWDGWFQYLNRASKHHEERIEKMRNNDDYSKSCRKFLEEICILEEST